MNCCAVAKLGLDAGIEFYLALFNIVKYGITMSLNRLIG